MKSLLAFSLFIAIPVGVVSGAPVTCSAEWVGEKPNDRPPPIAGHEVVDKVRLSVSVVRRNITDLSVAARQDVQAFSDAVRLLKDRDGNPETLHTRPVELDAYEALRAIHGHVHAATLEPRESGSDARRLWGQCVHSVSGRQSDGPLFLLWHRALVRAFEISANSALAAFYGQSFSGFGVPYWDWVVSPGLPEAVRCGETTEHVVRPSSPGRVTEASDHGHRNPLCSIARDPATRTDEGLWTPVWGINPVSTAHSDFTKLNLELEATWHDVIHGVVGGWMPSSWTAVVDPVFWLHHSQVDRLLEGWVRGVILRGGVETVADLEEQAGAGSTVASEWKKKRAIFPVTCGEKFYWYQPRFSDLVPLGDNDSTYRYDKTELPINLGESVQVDVSSLADAIETHGAAVIDLQHRRSVGSVTLMAGEPLVVPGIGARFRIDLGDIRITESTLNRLRASRHLLPMAIARARKNQRRAIMLSLDGARVRKMTNNYHAYAAIGRVLGGFGGNSRTPWRYLSSIGSFGLPIGLSEAGHHEHHTSFAPLLDVTDAMADWLSEPEISWRANGVVMEIAFIPIRATAMGELKPVVQASSPTSDPTPGLSFDSMTLWLRHESETPMLRN